jgi:transposase
MAAGFIPEWWPASDWNARPDNFGIRTISKRGDAYLRRLLTLGAQSWLRHHKTSQGGTDPWLAALQQRRPTPVAATALANKTARIAWVVMSRGETYRPRPARA